MPIAYCPLRILFTPPPAFHHSIFVQDTEARGRSDRSKKSKKFKNHGQTTVQRRTETGLASPTVRPRTLRSTPPPSIHCRRVQQPLIAKSTFASKTLSLNKG